MTGDLTRRDFLEQSAAIGVGAAALPVLPSLRRKGGEITLGNRVLAGTWMIADGKLRAVRITDHWNQRTIDLPPAVFTLRLADGTTIGADAMAATGPWEETLKGDPAASRLAERLGGRRVSVTLRDAAHGIEVAWSAVLREGASYLRQEVQLKATTADLPIAEIALLDLSLSGAAVIGSVTGSPVVARGVYCGFEHPLSQSVVTGDRVRCTLARELPLRPGAVVTVSSVIGTTRPGQRRRDFQAYVERERAHPYRPFLHYNTWYDLGYFSKFAEPECLEVIHTYGTELHDKRGVTLSSFLFDDGWDDPQTLWGFHAGFPRGFAAVTEAAAKYGAAPGVWLSPWGGYGRPKDDRLRYGREQGFETNAGGFALSGPTYYGRFRDTCLRMIREFGVNQFKFDGTGNAASAFPGSAFDSDFDAAITLIGELRRETPDLYVNLTTGTFPSPFWLRHADSIWRGGDDHDFAGVGSDRQQWITYRDGDTYAGIVQKGPLFPLNSLMLHGLIYAKHARKLDGDPAGDFRSEIRDYFGTGTQLQEMYVTPGLLSQGNWDDLAEAANWSRANALTLVDTHWVGGDPVKLEPYGWASWSRARGILTLRNPADRPQTLALDVARAFELPDGAPRSYTARSPWRGSQGGAPLRLTAGTEHPFTLAPFEVLTLEAEAR